MAKCGKDIYQGKKLQLQTDCKNWMMKRKSVGMIIVNNKLTYKVIKTQNQAQKVHIDSLIHNNLNWKFSVKNISYTVSIQNVVISS